MLTSAVMDVVVDGLMVSQSRLDPRSGSEDLQSYCWGIGGVGGMVGMLLGGWMTEKGWSQQSFLIGAVLGIIITISGCLMNVKNMETKQISELGCCDRSKHNCMKVKEGL